MEGVTLAAHRRGECVTALAPTRKAASGLHKEAHTDTVNSIQGLSAAIERGDPRVTFGPKDLVIIDEAGMSEMRHAAVVTAYATSKGARVIHLGDELQFSAIGAGAPFRLLREELGDVRLEDIQRQRVPWQREASLKMSRGDSVGGLRDYEAGGRVLMAQNRLAGHDIIIQGYAADLAANPDATRLVIAGQHRDVHPLNEGLRTARNQAGLLKGPEIAVQTLHRGGEFGEMRELRLRAGDELIVWKRVPDAILDNGDTMTLVRHAPGKTPDDPLLTLQVHKSKTTITLPLSALTPPAGEDEPPGKVRAPHLQHSYAVSLYSSQGMTVDRTWIYGGTGLDRAGTYVGLTRHRLDTQMVYDREAIADEVREQGLRPTREALREFVEQQATRSREKSCVADFASDRRLFAETGVLQAPSSERDPAERVGARMAAAEAEERNKTRAELRTGKAQPASEAPGVSERLQRAERRVAVREEQRRRSAKPDQIVAVNGRGEGVPVPDLVQRAATAQREARRARTAARREQTLEKAVLRAQRRTQTKAEQRATIEARKNCVEIDAACGAGGIHSPSWAIERTTERQEVSARQALLGSVPNLGPALQGWAKQRATEAAVKASATRVADAARLPEQEAAALTARFKNQPAPPVELERERVLREHTAGRNLAPFSPECQVLPPRIQVADIFAAHSNGKPIIVPARQYQAALGHERERETARVIAGLATTTGLPEPEIKARLDSVMADRRKITRIENNELRDAVNRVRVLGMQERLLGRLIGRSTVHADTPIRPVEPHAAGIAEARREMVGAMRTAGAINARAAKVVAKFDRKPISVQEFYTVLRQQRHALGDTPGTTQLEARLASRLDAAIGTLRESVASGRLSARTTIRAASPTDERAWRNALRGATRLATRPTATSPHRDAAARRSTSETQHRMAFERIHPVTAAFPLSADPAFDPTDAPTSVGKVGGGWRDGDHHRGRAAASLARGGQAADRGRGRAARRALRRGGATARGEPWPAVVVARPGAPRRAGGRAATGVHAGAGRG